jgi:hypothetical protein
VEARGNSRGANNKNNSKLMCVDALRRRSNIDLGWNSNAHDVRFTNTRSADALHWVAEFSQQTIGVIVKKKGREENVTAYC